MVLPNITQANRKIAFTKSSFLHILNVSYLFHYIYFNTCIVVSNNQTSAICQNNAFQQRIVKIKKMKNKNLMNTSTPVRFTCLMCKASIHTT